MRIGTKNRRKRQGTVICVMAAAILTSPVHCAQSGSHAVQDHTFHVRGTIRRALDNSVLQGVTVTFKGQTAQKTVLTNAVGLYELDLPLGSYSMTAHSQERLVRNYERPFFRVTAPTSITFDAFLLSDGCFVDFGVTMSGQLPDEKSVTETRENICGGADVFQVPSDGGVPFQVSIAFVSREHTQSGYVYSSRIPGQRKYGAQVLVAYNLLTVRADEVTYDEQHRTLHATGHVFATDETGDRGHGDSMTFKFESGLATLVQ